MCHRFNEYKSSQKIKFYHFSKDNRDENVIRNMTSEQLVVSLQQKNTQVNYKAWGNSVYMAFVPNISLGYAEDNGYLYEFELKNSVNYIESTEEKYAQGGLAGDDIPQSTIEFVKNELGFVGPNKEFMTFLGEKGYAFECFADFYHNKEFIVPVKLMELFKITSVQKINFNGKTGTTTLGNKYVK